MNSDTASILYDHYKETCNSIGNAVKRRDRLFLFVVGIMVLFTLQSLFPDTANQTVSEFVGFRYGINLMLDISVLGNVIWFLLLLFSVRYFQTAVFVERQYVYLHKLEDKINTQLNEEVITREGKAYLEGYPKFSNWMWFLYTIFFPALLITVASFKIFDELISSWKDFSLSGVFNASMFLLLTVSTILYLCMIHVRGSKKDDSNV